LSGSRVQAGNRRRAVRCGCRPVSPFDLDERVNPVSIGGRNYVCSMSRLKNFYRNVATSYLQLGVNVVYSLVSIPLILHWLSNSEFALWGLLMQLMSYIALVDLGLTSAVGRFFVDHKDRRSEGGYGALVKTSALVSVAQGLIILAVVTLGSPLLAAMMKITPEHQQTFVALMRIQGLITAFMFCLNPLAMMLSAHQRMDILIWQGMFTLVASLGLLLLFLVKGCGIYSFVYANAIAALIAPVYLFWHCRRLGFLPYAGEWGKVTWETFKELFLYGKDVFLINLGAQLITASQVIIVFRTLGSEAAAAWLVGTKIFMLMRQIMFQPFSAASAGLCEMLARNETERLRNRFKNLVVLTASLGVVTGMAFVLCNSLFITVWTGGKIAWPPLNDVLLGLWIFITALQVPHCNFIFVTKQIGGMRYLYFVEGCSFVALSLLVGYRWGLPGIIACSLLCLIFFSYQFGLRRSERYFQVHFWELAVDWVRPSLKLAVMLALVAVISWFATVDLPVIWRLTVHGVVAGFIGGFLFLRIGLPPEMVREAGARLPRPAARLLEMLVPCEV
jgi:O-antigen/teichoic acid export membrane protein